MSDETNTKPVVMASLLNNYHYNSRLQPLASQLRQSLTKAEASLWKYVLRAKGLDGYGFRRQRPILNYIVDFVSFDLMLVIEVDGVTHTYEDGPAKDAQKDADLESIGFRVLRFTDEEVLNDMNRLYDYLLDWIKDNRQSG